EQTQPPGPLLPYKDDIQQLSLLAPGLMQAPTNAEPTAVNLTSLKVAEQDAYTAYLQALTQQQTMQGQLGDLQTTFYAASAQLIELKAANQAALAAATVEQN